MNWQTTGNRFLAIAILCLFQAASALAQPFWMTEPAVRQALVGATIAGEYADGRTFTESYAPTGSLTYSESTRNRNWTGHWSVVRGRFCTIYNNVGTGGCYRIHQVSANCFEFYFDSRTEEEARKSTLRRPTWTARAWRTDAVSTCQERPMV